MYCIRSLVAQEAAAAAGGPRVQFLVLDLSPVQHVDASAVRPTPKQAQTYPLTSANLCTSPVCPLSTAPTHTHTRWVLSVYVELTERVSALLLPPGQVRVLFDLAAELHSRGIQFVAANPSDRVAAMFERSGLLDALGDPPTHRSSS